MKPIAAAVAIAVLTATPFAPAVPPATRPGATPPVADRAVPTVPGGRSIGPVKELNFDQIALTDAVEYFRDLTGLNIDVNWKALEEVGLSKDTPVSLRLRGVKVGVAIQKTLDAAGPGLLGFYVDDSVVHITTRAAADERMVTRVYSVDDLITDVPDFEKVQSFQLQSSSGRTASSGSGGGGGGGSSSSSSGVFSGGGSSSASNSKGKTRNERADELISLIQETIRPEVWNVNGGKAAMRFSNGKLVVTAPLDVHKAIAGN